MLLLDMMATIGIVLFLLGIMLGYLGKTTRSQLNAAKLSAVGLVLYVFDRALLLSGVY